MQDVLILLSLASSAIHLVIQFNLVFNIQTVIKLFILQWFDLGVVVGNTIRTLVLCPLFYNS